MQIDDPVGESSDEGWWNFEQEAGQYDEIDGKIQERFHVGISVCETIFFQYQRGDTVTPGQVEYRGTGFIGDDQRNADARVIAETGDDGSGIGAGT